MEIEELNSSIESLIWLYPWQQSFFKRITDKSLNELDTKQDRVFMKSFYKHLCSGVWLKVWCTLWPYFLLYILYIVFNCGMLKIFNHWSLPYTLQRYLSYLEITYFYLTDKTWFFSSKQVKFLIGNVCGNKFMILKRFSSETFRNLRTQFLIL